MITAIVVAVLSSAATGYVAKKGSETTLQKTNYDNATNIYDQYRQLNEDLKREIDEKNAYFTKQIEELRQMINEMEVKFQEREAFLEREIEIRDDRIEELEIIIVTKDELISELRKGVNVDA